MLSKCLRIGQFKRLYVFGDPTPTPGAEPEDQLLQIHTDHDLETPDDSIFDLMNSQAPSDEQLNQALQTYQALTSLTRFY